MKLATGLLRHAIYAVFTLVLKMLNSKHVKQTTILVNMLNLCSFINYDYGNQVLEFQSIDWNRIIRLYLFLTGLLLLTITAPIQEFSK